MSQRNTKENNSRKIDIALLILALAGAGLSLYEITGSADTPPAPHTAPAEVDDYSSGADFAPEHTSDFSR